MIFIYGVESIDTSIVHFSDDVNTELFKLLHFDAIFICEKKFNQQRKDNRSELFPIYTSTRWTWLN